MEMNRPAAADRKEENSMGMEWLSDLPFS